MGSASDFLRVKEAVDLTLCTIERRTRLYRNLVVLISVLLVGSSALAVALRSWRPLLGLIIMVPATAAYIALDARRVRRWISDLQELRHRTGLSYDRFSQTIRQHPGAPRQTVLAMLAAYEDACNALQAGPDSARG